MDRRWLFVLGLAFAVGTLWLALAPIGGSHEPAPIGVTPPAEAPLAAQPSAPAQPVPSAVDAPVAATPGPSPTAPGQQPITPAPHRLSGFPVPERIGPVDDLKHSFETEARDQGAHDAELEIEKVYRAANIPSGLFKRVVCRSSVCRIELDWTPERASGYLASFMGMMMGKRRTLGIEPLGQLDEQNRISVYAYLTREGASVPTPSTQAPAPTTQAPAPTPVPN